MMPSSHIYDVEIGIALRAETPEQAWETIYRAVHDILESMYQDGQVIDWGVSEPRLVPGFDEELQSP